MSTRREIGSEFNNCLISKKDTLNKFNEWDFFMSGRTALDAIIRDIKSKKNVSTALLPAYCCHSMVDPFVRNGIDICFYDVDLLNAEKICDQIMEKEYDIVLIMNYFGIAVEAFEKELEKLLLGTKDKITIVDITHSLFSDNLSLCKADYYFCSLRKWTGLYSGGMAFKKAGVFNYKTLDYLEEFVKPRKLAMTEKENYLVKGGEKSIFLDRFAKAEELLDQEYEGYGIDSESLNMFLKLDFEKIREERKKNFAYLLESKDILMDKGLVPIVSLNKTDYNDVPLCFPVVAKSETLRNNIRKHLISNDIFCPVHWPLPSDVPVDFKAFDLSKRELSLVCDQRYNREDMKRIIDVIKEYEP